METLRKLAETGFWPAPDRFRAARMLGRQLVDALEHREVAMTFVASRGIVRLGKNEFDDLRGDMDEHALDLFMLRVKARFSGPVSRIDRSRIQTNADRSRR